MGWQEDQRTNQLLMLILQKQQQLLNAVEQININGLQASISNLAAGVASVQKDIDNRINTLQTTQTGIAQTLITLTESLTLLSQLDQQNYNIVEQQLLQILKVLIPPPAVTCIGTITLDSTIIGEDNIMATKRALVANGDLAVADNGTFTGTLTFKDSDGVTTSTPAGLSTTFTSSDASPGPSIFNLVNPGPSGDGSTFAGTVNQTTVAALVAAGTPLPTALTISFTATWTGLATPISGTFTPALDVVAGPAATAVAVVSEP